MVESSLLGGNGIGRKLMAEIETVFPTAKRFELFTGHKSERNLYLYRKLGYEIFKQQPVNEKLSFVFLEKVPRLNLTQMDNANGERL
jgi:hypothetical protein